MERVAARDRATIEPHDSVERYTGLGVDVVLGQARIVDPWTVRDDARPMAAMQTLTTRAIVIATGAGRSCRRCPGCDEVGVLTSDTLWDAARAAEAAGRARRRSDRLRAGAGVRAARLAGDADRDARRASWCARTTRCRRYARTALETDGVTVLTGHKALRCERDGDGEGDRRRGRPAARSASSSTRCSAPSGRVARLKGYGLEELGIPAGSARSRPTSTCRRSTRTSTPAATWPGRSSSRTRRRTRPGTRR